MADRLAFAWPRYLFVVGCPRSGTTALWKLLISHPRIVLGIERYRDRYLTPEFLDRSLFERDRFFRIEPGDTFYDDLDALTTHYGGMRPRYDQALYRGDKIPMLFTKLAELEAEFGDDLRVLMIVRDPMAVAESWQARHDDPEDRDWPDSDVADAVREWNRALEVLRTHVLDPRFHGVSYERLFERGEGLAELFTFLDLPLEKAVTEEYSLALRRSGEIAAQRKPLLSDEQRRYVREHAKVGDYAEVLDLLEPRVATTGQL